MMSPGGGQGARAAAIQKIRAISESLLAQSGAFDVGSKEQQTVLRAVTALNSLLGKNPTGTNMVPAAIQAMLRDAGGKGPPPPPPGMSGAPPGPGGPPPMPVEANEVPS